MHHVRLVLAAFAALSLAGCYGSVAFAPAGAPIGFLYAEGEINKVATEGASAAGKSGESCATSILGLVTIGDASAQKAMEDGGITKVSVLDAKYRNILGIYTEYCTIAYGQ